MVVIVTAIVLGVNRVNLAGKIVIVTVVKKEQRAQVDCVRCSLL